MIFSAAALLLRRGDNARANFTARNVDLVESVISTGDFCFVYRISDRLCLDVTVLKEAMHMIIKYISVGIHGREAYCPVDLLVQSQC